MVKLVIVSHGLYAQGMLETSRMLIGEYEDVYAVSLEPGGSSDDLLKTLESFTSDSSAEKEVLFLCDLLSGTPFNICSAISYENPHIKVFYGINLPLLLEAITQKDNVSVEALACELLTSLNNTVGIGEL